MSANIPFYYEPSNVIASQWQDTQVFTQKNGLARYYQRYLLQKAMSVFEWELPEKWLKFRGKDYFLYCLYVFGFAAVVKTDKFGVIPQGCTLGGFGVFYEPKWAVIANPLLKGILKPIIGKECELIKLQPDYGGIMDIVYQYAEQMALASQAVSVNLINSKFSYVFAADNKAHAESFKKMYDDIASGNPATVVDKNLFNADGSCNWQLFMQNLKQQYIASDILSDMKKIEAEFDTRIGIPNANTDKRERLITDEVNANNAGTNALAAQWKTSIEESIDRVKNMFGEEAEPLSVKWRDLGGGVDSESIPVDSRSMELR